MVMGHIGFGEKFDLFIHAFHMPMFFFVSGFLFRNSTIYFVPYCLKKVKSLLIPYFVFAAIHYAVNSIICGGFSFDKLMGLIYPDSKQIPIAGALWFLVALFFADIIYYWIYRINNNGIQWIIVCTVSLFGQIVPARFGFVLPFALGPACVGVGLMHIGRCLRKFEYHVTSIKAYLFIFFGVLICFSILQSEYVDMRRSIYPYLYIVFWVNAVAASIIGMNIAKGIKTVFGEKILCKYLQGIGKKSIVYVCLTEIVILLSWEIVPRITTYVNLSGISIKITKVLCLFLSLLLLFLLSLLFEKPFFRVLIGNS